MGIKDEFHQKSILVCVDELCGRNPDDVSIHAVHACIRHFALITHI